MIGSCWGLAWNPCSVYKCVGSGVQFGGLPLDAPVAVSCASWQGRVGVSGQVPNLPTVLFIDNAPNARDSPRISKESFKDTRRLATMWVQIMASSSVTSSGSTAVDVETRAKLGRGGARAARLLGKTPGVIYGGDDQPLPINMAEKQLVRELHSGRFFNSLYGLKLDGKTVGKVMVKELQRDPVSDRPTHVDFLRVTGRTRVRVAIPVRFFNQSKAPGLSKGGILAVVRHSVEVDCLVSAMPEEIACDLTGVELNETIHVSHVKLPKGVEPVIRDRDFVLANITGATIIEVEDVAEDGEEEVVDTEEA